MFMHVKGHARKCEYAYHVNGYTRKAQARKAQARKTHPRKTHPRKRACT
jgi:hypothetical protein